MRAMPTFTNPRVLARPVQNRITFIETAADVDYFADSCNGYPDSYGNYTAAYSDPVPVLGSYLVEELAADGELSGLFELMAAEKFKYRFLEVDKLGLVYGVRGNGERGVELSRDIGSARKAAVLLQRRYDHRSFEVVFRAVDSDDEWTVVGP